MHLICWLIPLASTLLPLTTSRYGRDDDAQLAWCFIEGNSYVEIIWVVFSFYLIMVASMLTMVYYSIRIHLKYRDIDLKTHNPEVHAVVDMLWMYPVAMMVNWIPNLTVSILANIQDSSFHTDTAEKIFNLVTILATQNGTFTAIIFFMKSKEARYRWNALLFGGKIGVDQDSVPQDFANDSMYARFLSMDESKSGYYHRASDSLERDKNGSDSIIKERSSNLSLTDRNSHRRSVQSSDGDGDGSGGYEGWNSFSTSPIPERSSIASAMEDGADRYDINSPFSHVM